jgi:hypothetical protein
MSHSFINKPPQRVGYVGHVMYCDNINIEFNNIEKSGNHVGLFIFITIGTYE